MIGESDRRVPDWWLDEPSRLVRAKAATPTVASIATAISGTQILRDEAIVMSNIFLFGLRAVGEGSGASSGCKPSIRRSMARG